MHRFHQHRSQYFSEQRLCFGTLEAGNNTPRPIDVRVEAAEQVTPRIGNDREAQQQAGGRKKKAGQEAQDTVASLRRGDVPISVDRNNPEDPVARSLNAVRPGGQQRTETGVAQGQEQERMIGEGLEMSPEEQRYLLQMETKYRQECQRASKQGGFNQVEFKKNWIDQHGSEVAANTKFRLNPGVPGSPCIGIHTEKAPYKEPTPDQVRVLRGIEQRYNQEMARVLRQNGNRPLPVQQFKREQIAKFNQELAANNAQLRFHMGIPESYSFGVDWDGANAAEPPRNALVGGTERPQDAAGRAADRLNTAPEINGALEAFLAILGALIQKVADMLENFDQGERKDGKSAEEARADADVQKEIDAELKKPGITRDKLREQTEGKLKGAQEEAKKLGETIPAEEKKLAELGQKEQGLQRQIDKPAVGANVDELKTQLQEVRKQKEQLTRSIGEKKDLLDELKKNVIPRLERKKKLLGAERNGEKKRELTEQERDQLETAVRNLSEQLDPQIREHLGKFRLGLTEDGKPAIFAEGEGVLKTLAGEDGYITVADLQDSGFKVRAKETLQAVAKKAKGKVSKLIADIPHTNPPGRKKK